MEGRAVQPIADSPRAAWALYFLFVAAFIAPLFQTTFLPGLDLPFHLSVADMLQKGAASPYGAFYDGGLQLAPYTTHFLLLRLLSPFMSLLVAHKIVIALYVALFPLALARLLVAFELPIAPAVLGFPFAYCMPLQFGFVSFALSLPAMAWLLAEVVDACANDNGARRWLWVGLSGVVLYLSHLQNYLFALGLCALLLVILPGPNGESRAQVWRRKFRVAIALLPSFAALVWFAATNRTTVEGDRYSYRQGLELIWRLRRQEIGATPVWRAFWERLHSAPEAVLGGFNDRIDETAMFTIFALLGAIIIVGCVFALRERRARTSRDNRLLLARLLLGTCGWFCFAAMPHHIRELALMTFAPRFAIVAAMLSLLFIPAALRRAPRVARMLCFAPLCLVSLWFAGELVTHYRAFNAELRGFEVALRAIPPGKRVTGFVYNRNSKVVRASSSLVGLPYFYPAYHHDQNSFVPLLYCGMSHMPCAPLANHPVPSKLNPWDPATIKPSELVQFYDYVLVRGGPPAAKLFGDFANRTSLVTRADDWILYAIVPAS